MIIKPAGNVFVIRLSPEILTNIKGGLTEKNYWLPLSQMNNTGLFSPIPIPIQYSSLNQQYQYNPNTNTIPIDFKDLV